MVLAKMKERQDLEKREAWLNSNLRKWAAKYGIPKEEFPKHYERAEGFAIGYEKAVAIARAETRNRNRSNAKMRAWAKERGIP